MLVLAFMHPAHISSIQGSISSYGICPQMSITCRQNPASQRTLKVMVGGGHDLVLSLGFGNGNAHTRGLKRGCPKEDGKINNK